MTKERILEILEGAKDETASVPMSLVRKAFENISNEQHWIPTNKERPPQHQEIWITDDFGDVELVYGKDGIWWLDESYYTEPEIIAWMPASVPEPYQPEEESE